MRKRLFALSLCAALLFAAITPTASAASIKPEDMEKQCRTIYRKTLYNTSRSSLNGVCGLMAGYSLWLLDATKSPEVYDGNDYFDHYCKQLYTSMGNKVRTYSADTYSLAEALYTVTGGGTRDVYNLIACFQWTNTNAGRRYGHAIVIHAILDGMVYFVESFRTSIGGAEGNPLVCTIEEFENFYGDWTRYEGLVVLGKRDYTDYCTTYGTDLFIEANKEKLFSQPCEDGENDCVLLGETGKNDVIRATAVLKNDKNQLYYQVEDGGRTAYLPVANAAISRVNTEGVYASAEVVALEGQPWQLQGELLSTGSIIHSVMAEVSSGDGTRLADEKWLVGSRMFDFAQLNALLAEICTPENTYTVKLTAQMENNVPADDRLYIQRQTIPVWEVQLNVGADTATCVPALAEEASIPDGWHWDGQTRYYYRDGKPRTGWFCQDGADYYFKEDGSVTTGWAMINGYARYFTEMGIMRTGWVQTELGWHYMRSNGAAVSGFNTIGGKQYYFNEEYTMLQRCTVMVDGVLYVIDANGVVIDS